VPRIIDHDERRLQVAKVVEDLVYEQGVAALTVRDVARRVGCSTSIVSHYFASKQEMLVFTHGTIRRRAEDRLRSQIEDGHDIVTCLRTLLPSDAEGRRDWHTFFAFWGLAPSDPTISREWLAGTSGAQDLFAMLLAQARETGEISASVEPERDACKMLVIVNGIASLVQQDQASWPLERQIGLLKAMLASSFGYREDAGTKASPRAPRSAENV